MNTNKNLQNEFGKVQEIDDLRECLELESAFLSKIIELRKRKIESIDLFVKQLEAIKRNNNEVQQNSEFKAEYEKCKSLLSTPGSIFISEESRKRYQTNFDELKKRYGIYDIDEYNEISADLLYYTYVCSVYGHEFERYNDGSIAISRDDSRPAEYSNSDFGPSKLLREGTHGNRYCQCKLCKMEFVLQDRPVDFYEYSTDIPKMLNQKPQKLELMKKSQKKITW